MKVVALVSGGKDSCFAMMKCIEYGHEIVALANLMPLDDSIDELDSYMFQTVGHQIVVSYAECMGLPLFRRRIHGSSRQALYSLMRQNLSYIMTQDDEVEDLYILLSKVKEQMPSVTAVSSGAIASDYQRLRVENICSRLGLVSLAYLWKQDQSLLLKEMISKGIEAITVKVAAMGLLPSEHLGKEIGHLQHYLHQLKELYGINVCGEGGEYETLTLNCPLFVNAKIVLDNFKVVQHSLDSIAPAGVLHPLAFHLEHKREFISSTSDDNDVRENGRPSVFEVEACVQHVGALCHSDSEVVMDKDIEIEVARTKRDDTFSVICWIHGSSETSGGLQGDLAAILKKIDLLFSEEGFGWADVLYIHLYISDMNEFALANETYVSFITEEKCHMGVPSRSTIELPLTKVGLGRAAVEVLVATDQSKKVLHVQSISCWAPSCIGPYSQATLHKELLYMAGQLGLYPPTMKLCQGGAIAEMDQALENCEAVAKNFNCSLASSAIILVIYCSASMTPLEKKAIQGKINHFLKQGGLCDVENGNLRNLLDVIFLFILTPDLPKSALVEVKPILYVPTDEETESGSHMFEPSCLTTPDYWGFDHFSLDSSFCQKCVIHGKLCAVSINITNDLAMEICSVSLNSDMSFEDSILSIPICMKKIARFCIYLLDKSLLENQFSWEDITNLRFYFPVGPCTPSDSLFSIFRDAVDEFAVISGRIDTGTGPIFNLVPVVGSGRSAESMDDLITCELFASKP
ncbi:hypothetical protein Sjap_006273 [Stephania japonica]|uniref:Diphthine--ammonia ligase n=1 Tax=Stephania japonica TaxID=461633 RepID=A0AAP0K851_9MAGN